MENNKNKGRPLTEEHKQSIAEASIGKAGTNTGKTFDEEWRGNMSEAHKGKVFTDEHKQNLSNSHLGHIAPNRKLNFALAEQMRSEYIKGGITQKQLAIKYGIAQSTLFNILQRKTYTK